MWIIKSGWPTACFVLETHGGKGVENLGHLGRLSGRDTPGTPRRSIRRAARTLLTVRHVEVYR